MKNDDEGLSDLRRPVTVVSDDEYASGETKKLYQRDSYVAQHTARQDTDFTFRSSSQVGSGDRQPSGRIQYYSRLPPRNPPSDPRGSDRTSGSDLAGLSLLYQYLTNLKVQTCDMKVTLDSLQTAADNCQRQLRSREGEHYSIAESTNTKSYNISGSSSDLKTPSASSSTTSLYKPHQSKLSSSLPSLPNSNSSSSRSRKAVIGDTRPKFGSLSDLESGVVDEDDHGDLQSIQETCGPPSSNICPYCLRTFNHQPFSLYQYHVYECSINNSAAAAGSSAPQAHKCPVCHEASSGMSEAEFEMHVNSHFND